MYSLSVVINELTVVGAAFRRPGISGAKAHAIAARRSTSRLDREETMRVLDARG
jgi:hypothetical protein